MGIEVYFILLLIGSVTFFFWKWLLTKGVKNPRKRKIAIWACTIIGTPILYLFIVWLAIFALSYYPDHKFDSEKWKNEPESRYELTKSLIGSKLLIGKSKREVEQLLGKTYDFKSNLWIYNVGFVPGLFNIDPDILEISFKNDKVVNVKRRGT
ncbi:hypothetical protein WG904_12390 [Pedobacter sp. Du54]|uniref:hypothetical protein n=1 Tax=Pedobacter anseongensis TaxID=3133439 RepID=UPI003099471A